jgi:SSS family solute:Na+ symporter
VSLVDAVVVVLFLAGLVGVAGWIATRQNATGDYYLGGRRMPAWALGLSLAANQVSAISLVGAPAFVALRAGGGLRWLQYELAVPLAMACLVVWGVPFLRRAPGAEVYQAVEDRLGSGPRRALALLFVVGRGLGAGVILLASARVVAACTGWSVELSLAVVGVVSIAYTALGGLVADVLSDVLQLGLLWGGTVIAIGVLWWRLGAEALAGVSADRLRPLALTGTGLGDGADFSLMPMLVGGVFLYLAYYGCDQTQAQRVLAAGDDCSARRALTVAALVRFPLVLTYCLFGIMLAALLAAEPAFADALAGRPPDELVPQFLVRYVPTGLLGVLVAGILAAALSSVDSAFNSLSAVTAEHLLPRRLAGRPRAALAWARSATVAWGAAAFAAALAFSKTTSTVIELVNLVGSVVNGPVLGVFLLAWRSRRADTRSTLAGVAAGLGANLMVAIALPGVSWWWWNVIGCLVTVAVGAALGRADRSPVAIDPRPGRSEALTLMVFFVAIVAVLVAIQLTV